MISIQGITKRFGDHQALAGVDLEVPEGSVQGLLGPNVAGKTTTVRVLTTLLDPDAGEAIVAGHSAITAGHEVRRRLGVSGQYAAVDERLTGFENLTMVGELYGMRRRDAKARARELLRDFRLDDVAETKRAGAYSGGMRRRLDLALSFVVTPEVLFLDEPTTGLDTRSRRDLWDLIRTVAATGTTVFLTTQYLEEADHLADRIAVLHAGRIAALGTPAELKARVGGDTVELHDAQGELIREIPTDGTVADLRRALDLLDEEGLDGVVTLRRPTLDDVFLAVTTSPRAQEIA